MPDDIDRAQERDLQYQADCEFERRYQAAHNAGHERPARDDGTK